jgi:hypothetical protein
MSRIDIYEKLDQLGISLPVAGAPAAAYVMCRQASLRFRWVRALNWK